MLIEGSCIKDEALNKEADIVKMVVPETILIDEPNISNDEITCYADGSADITRLSPIFQLTKGATIFPQSGTTMDFSEPRKYTVYSEDGVWSKEYLITFIKVGGGGEEPDTTGGGGGNEEPKYKVFRYHFDNYEFKEGGWLLTKYKYYQFFEVNKQNKKTLTWASGNEGYKLIPSADKKNPESYPTTLENNGYNKTAVKLVTRQGDSGHPIVSGSIFTGSFKLNISNPLSSTHFGMPFFGEPAKLKGYYKYKSGNKYQEMNNVVSGKRDKCSIYAVFYETDDATSYLDGNNILSSPNIVSVAQLSEGKEVDDWTEFELPFLVRNGKKIDAKKLKKGKYRLAIVFSSSKEGDKYNGAIGSTLIVDEVEIYFK